MYVCQKVDFKIPKENHIEMIKLKEEKESYNYTWNFNIPLSITDRTKKENQQGYIRTE